MPRHIEFDFRNTNVVITGASGGIGSAAAKRFVNAGASVFLHTFRNERIVQQLLNEDSNEDSGEYKKSGYKKKSKCSYCTADFSMPEERLRFFEQAVSFFPKIDIWVNAAGLDLMSKEIKHIPFEEKLKRIIETDVIAPVEFAEKIAPVMKKQIHRRQTGGTLFFFGWDGVDSGWGGETAELYGIAKGALQGFCKCFAESAAPQIKVRLLSPGWIETRWGKQANEQYQRRIKSNSLQNRWGTPDDVADAVLFFSSKESDYIDCNPVYINGGKRGTSREL